MPENANGRVRPREGKRVGDDADGRYGIPESSMSRASGRRKHDYIPNANEVNVDVDAERLLKGC